KFIMHFEQRGVALETERGTQDWNWSKFSHFVETPYFFHLYFDSRSFFLVPKDSFCDSADLDETRTLLREKIVKS
ncbi:MAG: YcxB family protein, partial [Chitinophagaceae bacterium]